MSENILEKQLFEIIKNKEMAEHIKLAKLDMLVRLGVDVNAMYGAKSLLKLANEVNNQKVIEFLEEKGAKDIFDEETAKELGVKLCEICGREAKDINIAEIKELINMGAVVDVKDNKGWTALINASRYGHKEIAEVLIKSGADVNATIEYSNGTALMKASYYGYKEIAELLIKNGADVNIKSGKGQKAIMLAKNEEIRKAIIEAVKKRNEKTGENVIVRGIERE